MVIEEENIGVYAKPITYTINENGCWICTSHCSDKDGYFKLTRNNKCLRMHRYIYTLYSGDIPKGFVIRHKCDNPSCINPNHLEVGTSADNSMDRDSRGHGAKGVRNGGHKLTESDVLAIRKDSRTCTEIANEYDVSKSTIAYIKKGKTWKTVDTNNCRLPKSRNKISDECVLKIRSKFSDGIKLTTIAKEYNVTVSCIYKIVHMITRKAIGSTGE